MLIFCFTARMLMSSMTTHTQINTKSNQKWNRKSYLVCLLRCFRTPTKVKSLIHQLVKRSRMHVCQISPPQRNKKKETAHKKLKIIDDSNHSLEDQFLSSLELKNKPHHTETSAAPHAESILHRSDRNWLSAAPEPMPFWGPGKRAMWHMWVSGEVWQGDSISLIKNTDIKSDCDSSFMVQTQSAPHISLQLQFLLKRWCQKTGDWFEFTKKKKSNPCLIYGEERKGLNMYVSYIYF